ncbi:TonB-dependent receptor [Enterovirga sp. DB1703]|uniref:TonB-dependent receptor n=1 Tax=Enterovirga aerilata TaxID=2730920 RepID=A0A849IA25_9HYPH|nr:TonB-dependent receptor [Enterovirga sp. DB1703]
MPLPDVVVTADRRPEPIGRSASAITVVTREELQSFSPTNLVDALRNVPGLDVSDAGGPGSTTVVRLRGANTGQTLVLIDGIRVNDPTSASGEFDFSNLLPTAIERIEVLRGPQSALYGSDAIGGVVNIITRSGGGQPRFEARTEGGSYGTFSSSATASGSVGPWSYAFSGGGQTTNGFSRYGYRIPQLERRFGKFEPDGFTRWGGYGRLGYDAGEGVRLEIGMLSFRTFAEYDAGSSTLPRNVVFSGNNRIFPDTPAETTRTLTQIWGRGTAEQGPLTHTLQVYANQTDREFRDLTYRANPVRITSDGLTEFRGDRVGTEYQGDLRLQTFGTLTFGGRVESEKATTFSTSYVPGPTIRTRTLEAQQDTRSVFALYQLPIGERVILSAGGRHDEVNRLSFDTWRATGAFLIPETGTKLRASGGTGGKAPTLYQLFEPRYGNPGLSPETSIGWDAGIDQTFWDGRLAVAATVFGNRFQNMIEFDSPTSRYFNVSRAKTSGVELEGALVLWPEFLKLTGVYTYLDAKDERTNRRLQRRPPHVGRIGLGITPLPGLLIEPRVTLVSERFSGNNETLPLHPYARLDIYGEYRFDETWRVFGRIENVTDARYQEILNYGTTGRAVYAGLGVTW